MKKPARVAVYARCSTQHQTTDLQVCELLEYCKNRGFQHPVVYREISSGLNARRPVLQQLLKETRRGRFQVVIVWKLDRLGRSLKQIITLLHEFTELRIDFIAVNDSVDFSTSSGRLMAHLVGAFAEFEAALTKERVLAGLRTAKAKGKRLGRPKIRDDRRIQMLRDEGLTVRAIASSLHVSKSTVQRSISVPKTL